MSSQESYTLIGIGGLPNAGKDTLGAKIAEISGGRIKVTHFADTLKTLASRIFGLSLEQCYDQELKDTVLPLSIHLDRYLDAMNRFTGLVIEPKGLVAHTPRQALQYFGTEYVRSVEDNYWIDATIGRCINEPNVGWVIPDVRFPNEAKAIRALGGFNVRVLRDNQQLGVYTHAAEQGSFVPDVTFNIETGNFAQFDRAALATLAMASVDATLSL